MLSCRLRRVEKNPNLSDCEVFVNGTWHVAKVLTWSGSASGWWAYVCWWPTPARAKVSTFPEEQVRAVAHR